jgi:F-type H+-transporting ATPase subunit epsilon
MSTIDVVIVSAEGQVFSGPAEMVIAPARMGEVGIAPRHAPLLTTLKPGEIRLKVPGGEEQFFYVTGGVLEVQPHLVTVLADTCLHGDALDEAAAAEDRKRAEEAMKGAAKEDLKHAQEQLVEAEARYRAAQRLKGKRR